MGRKKESSVAGVMTGQAFHAARGAKVVELKPELVEPPSKPKPRRVKSPEPVDTGRLDSKTYQLKPHQHQALTRVAVTRMLERGRGQPDASEVIREFFDACWDAWLENRE
jgi:hypothetical protein